MLTSGAPLSSEIGKTHSGLIHAFSQHLSDPDGREKVRPLIMEAQRNGRRMKPPIDPATFRRARERLGLTEG